jgi:hypothetical protein
LQVGGSKIRCLHPTFQAQPSPIEYNQLCMAIWLGDNLKRAIPDASLISVQLTLDNKVVLPIACGWVAGDCQSKAD